MDDQPDEDVLLTATALRALLRAAATAVAALTCVDTHALESGFYVGGGALHGETRVGVPAMPGFDPLAYDEDGAGWKALVGLRPLPLLGFELAYADFGSQSSSGLRPVHSELTAVSLTAVGYAPLPLLPLVDVFGRAGIARLDGELRSDFTPAIACPAIFPAPRLCGPDIRQELEDEVFTAAAGLQVSLGSFAIRGEYELFFTSGPDHRAASITVTKTFF